MRSFKVNIRVETHFFYAGILDRCACRAENMDVGTYRDCQKTFQWGNLFSTTPYAALTYLGTLLWEAV